MNIQQKTNSTGEPLFVVMSGTEWVPGKPQRSTLFERNAVGLNEAEAELEARRRTNAEKAIGHKHITWFPSPHYEF